MLSSYGRRSDARIPPCRDDPICDSLQTIFRATRAQQKDAGAGVAERHEATA